MRTSCIYCGNQLDAGECLLCGPQPNVVCPECGEEFFAEGQGTCPVCGYVWTEAGAGCV